MISNFCCCDILINGPPFDRLLNSGSRIIRENSVRGGKRRIDSNSKEDTHRIEGEAKTVWVGVHLQSVADSCLTGSKIMEVFSKSHYYGQNSSQQEVHSALLKTNIFENVGCKDYSLNNGSEKKRLLNSGGGSYFVT